ncbi:hypothetical protein PR048_028344 [Dryococelus australis]|uniref:CHK kinase-like domain-containing protein n=1 Tax=Dryococelus australis TaxID=614101 RepID=A0ABQ9GJ24_9NEOP|nr:hypothetical protein PR048_028344 [Dryococelus australis]
MEVTETRQLLIIIAMLSLVRNMANEEKRNLTARDIEKLVGRKVTNLETKKLTAPGDNYGSFMLAVDATLDSGRNVALVAKMFPVSDIGQRIFQSPITMKKEIGVYHVISPEYKRIQEEQSVPPSQRLHVFCSCPGARLTLGDNDEDQLADENAVLLMENLKVQGYRSGDRVSGLDKKHTEYVLEHLAKFHATAIAIKMKKPLVFRNKLLSILTPLKIKLGTKQEALQRSENFLKHLLTIPACNRNIDALKVLFMENIEFTHSDKFRPVMEPYATFTHYDLWTNNMMFKYKTETDEDPVDLKIVDFQSNSPAAFPDTPFRWSLVAFSCCSSAIARNSSTHSFIHSNLDIQPPAIIVTGALLPQRGELQALVLPVVYHV